MHVTWSADGGGPEDSATSWCSAPVPCRGQIPAERQDTRGNSQAASAEKSGSGRRKTRCPLVRLHTSLHVCPSDWLILGCFMHGHIYLYMVYRSMVLCLPLYDRQKVPKLQSWKTRKARPPSPIIFFFINKGEGGDFCCEYTVAQKPNTGPLFFFFFFFFKYPPYRCADSTVWLLHGWCHVKLLPSLRQLCVHHTTMHQYTLSLHSKPHR